MRMRPIGTWNKRREIAGDVREALDQRDARGSGGGEMGESLQDDEGNLYWMWGWSRFGGTTRPKLATDVFGGDGMEYDGVAAYVSSGDGMQGVVGRTA